MTSLTAIDVTSISYHSLRSSSRAFTPPLRGAIRLAEVSFTCLQSHFIRPIPGREEKNTLFTLALLFPSPHPLPSPIFTAPFSPNTDPDRERIQAIRDLVPNIATFSSSLSSQLLFFSLELGQGHGSILYLSPRKDANELLPLLKLMRCNEVFVHGLSVRLLTNVLCSLSQLGPRISALRVEDCEFRWFSWSSFPSPSDQLATLISINSSVLLRIALWWNRGFSDSSVDPRSLSTALATAVLKKGGVLSIVAHPFRTFGDPEERVIAGIVEDLLFIKPIRTDPERFPSGLLLDTGHLPPRFARSIFPRYLNSLLAHPPDIRFIALPSAQPKELLKLVFALERFAALQPGALLSSGISVTGKHWGISEKFSHLSFRRLELINGTQLCLYLPPYYNASPLHQIKEDDDSVSNSSSTSKRIDNSAGGPPGKSSRSLEPL